MQQQDIKEHLKKCAEAWITTIAPSVNTKPLSAYLEDQANLLFAEENTDRKLLRKFIKEELPAFIVSEILRLTDLIKEEPEANTPELQFKQWLLQKDAAELGIIEKNDVDNNLLQAASNKISEAMFLRAQQIETSNNLSLAQSVYLRAANMGSLPAALHLLYLHEKNSRTAIPLLEAKLIAAQLHIHDRKQKKALDLLQDAHDLVVAEQDKEDLKVDKLLKVSKRIYSFLATQKPDDAIKLLRWKITLATLYTKAADETYIKQVQQQVARHEAQQLLKQCRRDLQAITQQQLLSATELTEMSFAVTNLMAEGLEKTKGFQQTSKYATAALKEEPQNNRVLYILGEMESALGNTKAANNFYLQAARLGNAAAIAKLIAALKLIEVLNSSSPIIAEIFPRDPIHLDIIIDPVICPSGKSYERTALDKWFAYSAADKEKPALKKEPATGLAIPEGGITPNHALSKLYDYIFAGNADLLQYFQQNPIDLNINTTTQNLAISAMMQEVGFKPTESKRTRRRSKSV